MDSFPHREDYVNWSPNDINRIISQGGALSIVFHGYEDLGRMRRDFELRLDKLTSVEVWKRHGTVDLSNTHIQFPASVSDIDALGGKLI